MPSRVESSRAGQAAPISGAPCDAGASRESARAVQRSAIGAVAREAHGYPAGFRHHVLFGDVDALGHLNNVAIGRLFEEGRSQANRRIFAVREDGIRQAPVALASIAIDYLAMGRYPGEVQICTGIARVGTSSIVHRQALFQDGACLAVAEAVMVKVSAGRSAPLSEAERAAAGELQVWKPT
jgi:acyl-CoA thioester hydrolase